MHSHQHGTATSYVTSFLSCSDAIHGTFQSWSVNSDFLSYLLFCSMWFSWPIFWLNVISKLHSVWVTPVWVLSVSMSNTYKVIQYDFAGVFVVLPFLTFSVLFSLLQWLLWKSPMSRDHYYVTLNKCSPALHHLIDNCFKPSPHWWPHWCGTMMWLVSTWSIFWLLAVLLLK